MIGDVGLVQGVLLDVRSETTCLNCGVVGTTPAKTALVIGYTRRSCKEAFRELGCQYCGSKDVYVGLRQGITEE